MHHRGTYERPGLVLGLAPGGSTRGMAYRIAAADWARVYANLLEREQPTETYIEARRPVRLADGRRALCLVFLSDVHHPQWAGPLSLARQDCRLLSSAGLPVEMNTYPTNHRLHKDMLRDVNRWVISRCTSS